MDSNSFYFWLSQQQGLAIQPVVAFNPQREKLLALDFTEQNKALTTPVIEDVNLFSNYISQQLSEADALYGIGGYNEHRTVYARSRVFDGAADSAARCIHLGVDIWGKAGTNVSAPLDGMVHSFAFNDLENLTEGKFIHAGEVFAHFGSPAENGQWPPHLHFQLMLDMETQKGDYPGVCSLLDRQKYLNNCPDPDTLLNLNQWVK